MEATLNTMPTIEVATEPSRSWPHFDWSRCALERSSLDWAILEDAPGSYMFAKKASDGAYFPLWHVLFVGEAGNLAQHLRNHEMWPQAEALGATHIIVRPEPDPVERESTVMGWLCRFSPPLNPAD